MIHCASHGVVAEIPGVFRIRIMNGVWMRSLLSLTIILSLAAFPAFAANGAILGSAYAAHDAALQLDRDSAFWSKSQAVYLEKDSFGKAVPNHRTEVRTRWTKDNLYFFLFVATNN